MQPLKRPRLVCTIQHHSRERRINVPLTSKTLFLPFLALSEPNTIWMTSSSHVAYGMKRWLAVRRLIFIQQRNSRGGRNREGHWSVCTASVIISSRYRVGCSRSCRVERPNLEISCSEIYYLNRSFLKQLTVQSSLFFDTTKRLRSHLLATSIVEIMEIRKQEAQPKS
jgi:hypothetical protein